MLIVETKGSEVIDALPNRMSATADQVIVAHQLVPDFREFALLMHDGVRLVDREGNLIIDPPGADDFEDQGSRGFNYRSERFENRLASNPDISKVFSSAIHGDPATPLFFTTPGDPITVRFAFPADRARAHSFTIHDHKWRRSVRDLNSEIISVRGQAAVGTHDNFELTNGSRQAFRIPGDYMYRSGNIRWDIELGMWGIIRLLEKGQQIKPVPDKVSAYEVGDSDETR